MGIVFKSSFWTEATDLRTKDMSNGELGGKKTILHHQKLRKINITEMFQIHRVTHTCRPEGCWCPPHCCYPQLAGLLVSCLVCGASHLR